MRIHRLFKTREQPRFICGGVQQWALPVALLNFETVDEVDVFDTDFGKSPQDAAQHLRARQREHDGEIQGLGCVAIQFESECRGLIIDVRQVPGANRAVDLAHT